MGGRVPSDFTGGGAKSGSQRQRAKALAVTVLVAAKNEEVNLPKCLDRLAAFCRVVVLDSASTDGSALVCKSRGVEIVQFVYQGGYPKKRQWALDTLSIATEWVLLLDADEVVPDKLLDEIEQVLADPSGCDAFLIEKGFHFLGSKMTFGGFSHSAVLLFRKGKARFERIIDEDSSAMDMEVHERLIVDGKLGRLNTPLIHEDFKGLEAYIARHNRYSTWEAAVRRHVLGGGKWGEAAVEAKLFGNVQERRRWLKQIAMRLPGEPWLWFFYHFVLRLGFLEGRRGWIASQIRSQYIANVRAKMYEAELAQHGKLGRNAPSDSA